VRARGAVAAALGLAVGLGAAGPAGAAPRTITLDGWADQTAVLSGASLVVAEAATVHVNPRVIAGSPPGAMPFDYYRAETSRVRLNRARARFAGALETPVSVRTSIAAMGSGILAPGGAGSFVTAPSSSRAATPVIWCCDPEGVETVVESDGRTDAPVTLAATVDGARVRFLQARADGSTVLMGVDPVGLGERRTAVDVPVRTGAGLAALAPGLLAWVDPAAPAVLARAAVADAGLGAIATTALPGAAARVWASRGLIVVAARVGAGVRLIRVDPATGAASTVWRGARVPRVSVGGGAVAAADGRRVLASRSGALRPVGRGRGPVAAVAVDGRRVALLERVRSRGARVTVVRLRPVP
jgi:hypothetical protein